MTGNAFDVRSFKTWGVFLTAIGALQTVDAFECFFVKFGQLIEDAVPLGGFGGFLEELSVFLLPVAGLLLPVMQQITHI